MKITLSKSQWEMIGSKAGWMKKAAGSDWSATNKDYPDAGKKCPKCMCAMTKHQDLEKAKKGYKNCPKCNVTYSPESQTKQASLDIKKQAGRRGTTEAFYCLLAGMPKPEVTAKYQLQPSDWAEIANMTAAAGKGLSIEELQKRISKESLPTAYQDLYDKYHPMQS